MFKYTCRLCFYWLKFRPVYSLVIHVHVRPHTIFQKFKFNVAIGLLAHANRVDLDLLSRTAGVLLSYTFKRGLIKCGEF